MHRIGILCVVALLAACGSEDGTVAGPADSQSLRDPGPYGAGFVRQTVTYTSASTGEERSIPLRIWYPADQDAGVGAADYIGGELLDSLGDLGDLPGLLGDLGDLADLPDLPSNALDAPPVASDGPFPVAVYSHSSDSDGLLAYAYAEHLAEHGWIFLAPNHVGNTALDRLADTQITRARALALRPADVVASLDWLENAADTIGLEGAVDTGDALMIGHSRGGTTALMIAGAQLDVDALVAECERDPEDDDDCDAYEDPAVASALESSHLDGRFAAVVAQAPAGVPELAEGELAGIEVPVMLMTGDLDMTTPDADTAWDLLDGRQDVWIRLPEGGHLSFLSLCDDLDPALQFLLPSSSSDGCGPQFVRPEDAVEVLRAYVLAYGLRHSLGEDDWDAALQPPSLDENVEITAR